jgi:hypothetical protein
MGARSRIHVHVDHEVLSIDRSGKAILVRRDDGSKEFSPTTNSS